MSQKEERPELAGVRLKTRKRNIVVRHDPQSFADAVIDVLSDARETEDQPIEKTLEAANKVLETSELNFSRYGDVLFEVAFAGARLASGGNISTEGEKLPFNILACPAESEAIIPYIKWFQGMIRRKPFLVKQLEDTLIKLVKSLEFYDEQGRKKIAIAMARCFALKVGILPDHVLPSMLEERLVAKGTIATFITEFFINYLSTDSVESLVELLRKSKLEGRMLDVFPQQKRNWTDFEEHFKAADLGAFVEYFKRKLYDTHCQELRYIIAQMSTEDPPAATATVISAVNAKKQESDLADADVLKCVYQGLMDGVLSVPGRNQEQTRFACLKTLKWYHKVLGNFCTSARLEAAFINTIQVTCYEDSRLLRIFADAIKILYDADVVGEDAIRFWYNKGSATKGRNVFLKDMEPFIKWLDEAEEEEDDE